MEKSVVEKCCREVLERSVGEKSCRQGLVIAAQTKNADKCTVI